MKNSSVNKIADDFMVGSDNDTLPIPVVKYKVAITETLRRIVEIELPIDSYSEARKKVQQMYDEEEVIL